MEYNTKDSISKNIKRLLMFKSLKDISEIIDNDKEQDKKNKLQATIIIGLGVMALFYIIYFFSSYETSKRPEKTNIDLNGDNIQRSSTKP